MVKWQSDLLLTTKKLEMMFTKSPLLVKPLQVPIFLALLCGMALSCHSPRTAIVSGENQGWTLFRTEKGDQPSWNIYTRQLPRTSIYEYKIEGLVGATPEACILVYRGDILALAAGTKIDKKLTTYDLLEETSDSLLTYVIHNEPFPLRDTEMCVRYRFSLGQDGAAVAEWVEAWDQRTIPPSKKLKRIDTFRGSWRFSPTANDSCMAVNTVQFDPGKMPMWLVNPMVVKFLREGLEDIRTMAVSPQPIH